MKGSLVTIGFFVAGALAGLSGLLPDWMAGNSVSQYILYFLMFQVGMSIGSDPELKEILHNIRPKHLLVPLATISGTLAFSALAAVVISGWRVVDCMAVGSGFGYYSLSSILITQLREADLGVQLAAELGTIALISNIIREIITLLGAPWMVKVFGPLAPICAGGATTMDTTLPVITRYSGKDLVMVSVMHGIVVDLSVPLLVSLFSSFPV